MNDKELKPIESTAIAQGSSQQNPMSMMIEAKSAGFDMTEIKEMMDLQDRNDARIAKRAFDKAMADFKRNPPRVIKDRTNLQYGSTYVSIGNMVNTNNEAMGKVGLNANWSYPDSEDKSMMTVTCCLTHELGHEKSVTLTGPIDVSGAKNALQGRKSTRTYLKLETFEAVTGTASDEGNFDDDGNAANESITEEQAVNVQALMEEVGANKKLFLKFVGAESIDTIKPSRYDAAIKSLEAKRAQT